MMPCVAYIRGRTKLASALRSSQITGSPVTNARPCGVLPSATRTVPADCAVIPAEARRDDQIVLLGAVSINRAIGDAHALSANTSGLCQYTVDIAAHNGECAEPGKLRLLPAEPLVLLGEMRMKITRCGIAIGSVIQYRKPLGIQMRGIAGADDLLDDAQCTDDILGAVWLDDQRFAIGPSSATSAQHGRRHRERPYGPGSSAGQECPCPGHHLPSRISNIAKSGL